MRATLIKELLDYKIDKKFPNHTIYKWGTYGESNANDLDLVFVGEMNEEVASKLWDMHYAMNAGFYIDIVVHPDHKRFSHIERFNSCKDDKYYFGEKMIRYKLWEQPGNEEMGRKVKPVGSYFEIHDIFARKDFKYKTKGWPQPVLLKDFK